MSEPERAEVRSGLLAEDLWEVETHLRNKRGSEFAYDGKLGVFRFPDDGHFASCEEFADSRRLQELGHLDS